MKRTAVIKPCRKKDCPGKPASEKKWCLIDRNDTAKRCAPTKKQCEAQERNINYFKHNASLVRLASTFTTKAARAAVIRAALLGGYRPRYIKVGGQLLCLA